MPQGGRRGGRGGDGEGQDSAWHFRWNLKVDHLAVGAILQVFAQRSSGSRRPDTRVDATSGFAAQRELHRIADFFPEDFSGETCRKADFCGCLVGKILEVCGGIQSDKLTRNKGGDRISVAVNSREGDRSTRATGFGLGVNRAHSKKQEKHRDS